MKNTLSNIVKTKAIVADIAENTSSFEELVHKATHNEEIKKLVTTKYLNVIIQKYATVLA